MAKRILLTSKDGWTTIVRRHRRRRQDTKPTKRWTPRGRRTGPLLAPLNRSYHQDNKGTKRRPTKPNYLPAILSLLPVPMAAKSLSEWRHTSQPPIFTKTSTVPKPKTHYASLIPSPLPFAAQLSTMSGNSPKIPLHW